MIYWAYACPLFVVVLLSLSGSAQMIRTALVLLCNWIAGTAFVLATGIHDPWLLSIVLDGLSAFIILYQPAGRMQSVIGCTFIAQVMLHAVYFASDRAIAAYPYWQILTAMAFVQLVLLGGWVGGRWYRSYTNRSDHKAAVAHGAQGLAP